MRYHVINPEDATATVSGESVEMTLNAIDDVHNPVSAQIQTTLSIETAEKLASQLHTALMIARAHRAIVSVALALVSLAMLLTYSIVLATVYVALDRRSETA